MTKRFVSITPRSEEDVVDLHVKARVAGLEISHYSEPGCRVFDSMPDPNAQLGVFRKVGSLIFYKTHRRWEVRAYPDCNATDLASLITHGLTAVEVYGRKPGHYTRRRVFTHKVSARTGLPIAFTHVCYRLGETDLMQMDQTAEQPLDITVEAILEAAGTR